MAGSTALACSAYGAQVAWLAPTYKNSRPLWRFCEQMTAPVVSLLRINRTEREIEFPNGGRIGIFTGDNDVSIRGNAFDLVIVDEAPQIKAETWTDALMPTLADRDGRAMLIGTPKGKNWFWQEFVKAQAEGRAFTAPSNANPMPNIRRAFEMARQAVSVRTFRQEWLAEFVEDGAGVFRNVRACATASVAEPDKKAQYVIGVDWARSNDYTVFCVLDANTKRQVYQDRFTDIDYPRQADRLSAVWERYNKATILAEYNSMGGPMVEELQRRGLPVVSFTTTQVTKAALIDGLARAFDFREITILNDSVLIGELESYEQMKTSATGVPSFGAPEGIHDDTVIALGLAWRAAQSGAGVVADPFADW